jgi:hypothetical protein
MTRMISMEEAQRRSDPKLKWLRSWNQP